MHVAYAVPCRSLALALLCALWVGCGSGGLSGSIGKHLDLNYTTVTMTLTEGATGSLDVVYSGANGTVADVLVDSNETDLGDLLSVTGQDFVDRAHLTRSSGVKGSFPPVRSGNFCLSRHNFDVTRASVAGTFQFVFNEGAVLDGQFDGPAAVQLHF